MVGGIPAEIVLFCELVIREIANAAAAVTKLQDRKLYRHLAGYKTREHGSGIDSLTMIEFVTS